MTRDKPPKTPKKASGKEDRLKAALKANMARRKAQARARAGQDDATGTGNAQAAQDKDT